MDLAFSERQEALRTATRGYLAERFPSHRVAALADSATGWDPESWTELSALGCFDPGLGTLEHAMLVEEAGYVLYPGPLWSTLALSRPACVGRTPSGSSTMAWVDDHVGSLLDAKSASCVAEPVAGGWRLSGTKRDVPDAASADEAVVVAECPDGVALWRLDLTTHRDTVRPLSTVDSTRPTAELWLDGTPVEPLVPPAATPGALARVRRVALALLACEAVGVCQRALDIASAHAGPRAAVRRGAGSYPGVPQRVANMFTALQILRSLAHRAAWYVSRGDDGADEACATATVSAGHVALFICENAIESVGGLGYAADHPLRRLHRRAQWINAFEGFPAAHAAPVPSLVER